MCSIIYLLQLLGLTIKADYYHDHDLFEQLIVTIVIYQQHIVNVVNYLSVSHLSSKVTIFHVSIAASQK